MRLPFLQEAGGRSIHVKGKRYANPSAGFVQRDFFTHRGIVCCLSPARRRDARKGPLHYQAGPGPAGPGGGVAGAERATRTAASIPQPGQSSTAIVRRRPWGSHATVFMGRAPEQLWPYRRPISVIREIMESRM